MFAEVYFAYREYSTSMDSLVFVTSWSRGGIPDAKLTMKWSGLQMEGATFDGSRLQHNAHDSTSISVAPLCVVAWVPKVIISFEYLLVYHSRHFIDEHRYKRNLNVSEFIDFYINIIYYIFS